MPTTKLPAVLHYSPLGSLPATAHSPTGVAPDDSLFVFSNEVVLFYIIVIILIIIQDFSP